MVTAPLTLYLVLLSLARAVAWASVSAGALAGSPTSSIVGRLNQVSMLEARQRHKMQEARRFAPTDDLQRHRLKGESDRSPHTAVDKMPMFQGASASADDCNDVEELRKRVSAASQRHYSRHVRREAGKGTRPPRQTTRAVKKSARRRANARASAATTMPALEREDLVVTEPEYQRLMEEKEMERRLAIDRQLAIERILRNMCIDTIDSS